MRQHTDRILPDRLPFDVVDNQRVLGRAASLLSSSPEFEATLDHVLGSCVPALGDFGYFDVVHDGQVRRKARAREPHDLEPLLDQLDLRSLTTTEPTLHADIDEAWYQRHAADAGQLELMRCLRFRSMIEVPMRYADEPVGRLTLFMGPSGRRHSSEQLELGRELASIAAPVVVNARLLAQQQRAEEALRASEERLRLVIEAGQLGIWDWDVQRNHASWSDRVYELHGVLPGNFGGRLEDFAALVHPEDLAHVRDRVDAALRGDKSFEVEFRVPQPDGRVRWLASRAHVVRGSDQRPLRMVGATYDVTERMELLAAERAARAAAEAVRRRFELLSAAGALLSRSLEPQATLQAIASIVVPGIADWCRVDLVDAGGALQRALTHHADPQKARFGAELVGRLHAAPGSVGSMAWAVETGRSHLAHFEPPQQFDEVRDADLLSFARAIGMRAYFIVPLIARGRTLGALAALQAESGRGFDEDDCALIAELAQRAALALDNARLYANAEATLRQVQTANRAKDEFLAMLGHELRNPLAPIVTALHLMERRNDTATVIERRVIERQVAHLSRLVDDLLDVSRITKGKVQLERERVDMKAVVGRALELTQPALENRTLPIDVHLGAEPACVWGDPVRLTQALGNVLNNAVKFTPGDGLVRLNLRGGNGHVEITVEDAGSGIAPELLPHVFDLFVQGQQSSDRRAGGLGLGLAIARTIVQMHDGTVHALSPGTGRGSTFVITLPAIDPGMHPQPSLHAVTDAPRAGMRVLVVDDNLDAGETLGLLLRATGYEVLVMHDGTTALDALDGFAPDLAVLDIGLPGMDGYALAQRLKVDARVPGLRLVALTGYGRDVDRARALASGFDEHFVKPVAPERFLETLRRLLED